VSRARAASAAERHRRARRGFARADRPTGVRMARYGAFLEPNGRNRWQQLANEKENGSRRPHKRMRTVAASGCAVAQLRSGSSTLFSQISRQYG
jgi:hypothetical protein